MEIRKMLKILEEEWNQTKVLTVQNQNFGETDKNKLLIICKKIIKKINNLLKIEPDEGNEFEKTIVIELEKIKSLEKKFLEILSFYKMEGVLN